MGSIQAHIKNFHVNAYEVLEKNSLLCTVDKPVFCQVQSSAYNENGKHLVIARRKKQELTMKLNFYRKKEG